MRPEGEIFITHATFTFDVKEKPGVFEIRYAIIITAVNNLFNMVIYCAIIFNILYLYNVKWYML